MVNIDVPAGVGAPPLNTQLPLLYVCEKTIIADYG